MGKSRRIKTKRLAHEVLEKHPDRFTTDFEENKTLLEEILLNSTKRLRNKIAGYITSFMNTRERRIA
ncbi:30S ribosomal protein S17e [miscellaneous Crenarchaeota group archaeon SMTZ1-55]|nr:MAG: 30S ribosomal protein S17e [miscellaneous Crenarchaeota group archaeon SMTZ1-55]